MNIFKEGKMRNTRINSALLFLFALIFVGNTVAQDKDKKEKTGHGKPVMWETVNIPSRNLFDGPGGTSMKPDLSKIEFIEEEKGGHNKKFRIKDGSGRTWVAKLGREARPETAAVRLLWGIGYKTEINYMVQKITIPGHGTFEDVRLEARPDNIDRLEEWKWDENPFVGTKELDGLRMMMVFFNNWDVLDLQNKVLQVGDEQHYIVSDLGSTFGSLGNNNLPVVYRLGRSTGKVEDYADSNLVDSVEGKEVKLAYKGKNRDVFKGFTTDDARWLAELLKQLSNKQITDAFRAADFSPSEIKTYAKAVSNRILELDKAGKGAIAANK